MSVETKKNLLKKNTPDFIESTDELEALYTAIAKTINEFDTELQTLPVADRSGKGALLKCSENNILVRVGEEDNTLEDFITNRYAKNSNRGTESGIKEEIMYLANINDEEDIVFYSQDEVGDIIDVTYYDDITSFTDVNKLVEVKSAGTTEIANSLYGAATYGNSLYGGTKEVTPFSKEELVSAAKDHLLPIDTEIIITGE